MATVNPTRTRRPRKASERPALPLYGTPDTLTHRPPGAPALTAYQAPAGVLSFRHGLADHERAVIDAALAILGAYLRGPGGVIDSPDAVAQYLRLALAGERRELFAVLYLDAQIRAIAFEVLFVGTLTQTSVYPREVAHAALVHGAASVILAHNHPSGTPAPSRADETLTQTLKSALALVDVRVLDHVIVAGDQARSMAAMGLL